MDSLSEFNTLVDAKIMSDWKQDFDNFYSSASQQVQTDLNGFKTVPTVCYYIYSFHLIQDQIYFSEVHQISRI